MLKAKFHYASWFEAGRRQVRSWSPTSFEPVCDQLRTSFEPANVMEFGFHTIWFEAGSKLVADRFEARWGPKSSNFRTMSVVAKRSPSRLLLSTCYS